MVFFFRMDRVFLIFLILRAELSMTQTEPVKVHGTSLRWVLVFSCWVLYFRHMGIQSNNLVSVHGSP